MQKVIVIGCPGSGKSIFSQRLSRVTKLKLYHLDMLFHNADGTHISTEEFCDKLREVFKESQWILDGNYQRSLEMRMKECDTIFLLDYPTEVCLDGAKARIGTKRPDMPWVELQMDADFEKKILEFKETKLPEIYRLLEIYGKEKKVVVFKARAEAENWLESMESENKNTENKKVENKNCINGIVGLAIGDALGVPVEFKSREILRENPVMDMRGYGTHNMPAGTWSDDTSMTVATMDSILATKTIDCDDMASRFLAWFRKGEYTATGVTFDIGNTTMQALMRFERSVSRACECGENSEYSNGNGSLMRILPIAYYIYYKNIKGDDEIFDIVKQVSSITHAHEVSILGCYIYVRYVLELLNGKEKLEAYKNIQKLNYSMFSVDSVGKYSRILKGDIQTVEEPEISSSGYVVSTLEATLWLFLNATDYNTAVLKAVNLGDDTDTVGACVGGLLGLYYGIDSIKTEWKQELKKYDEIEQMCEEFEKKVI